MSERSLIQYQPVTGPVWREPVAERLAWLPSARQPVRGLAPNRLGDFVQPGFDALYKPATLEWSPSDRYAGRPVPYSAPRYWVIDPIPPVDPRQLSWQTQERYFGRPLTRGQPDLSIYPLQPPAVTYDPQDLAWSPRGIAPQIPVERRRGDFSQPAFDSLYKPEGLQWVLQGERPPRDIPFIRTGSWIIDPTVLISVPFDPQFFVFQSTDLAVQRTLARGLVGDFGTPPLPPGPDVIPPVAGGGGSSAVHPRRIVYERGDKRKPKTFIDRIGEPFVLLEETAEPVPDAKSAGALANPAPAQSALKARLPQFILTPEQALVEIGGNNTTIIAAENDEDDDDLFLLS